MNDGYPLTDLKLEQAVYRDVCNRVLPRAVRPSQIILQLTRAYQTLGHTVPPPILETENLAIPFYVFTRGSSA